jgi:hypothetical protein
MIIGEIESAQVVTPKTIYETKEDGTISQKEVWESLDATTSNFLAINDKRNEMPGNEMPPNDYEPVEIPSPQQEPSYTHQVSQQFSQIHLYI